MANKNKNKVKAPISLIIALAVEVLLLVLIALILMVALLGVFLPFLPGIFFLGLAVGIYTLVLKSNFNNISSRFHPKLLTWRENFLNLKIMKKPMGIIKAIKKKKIEKEKTEILKYGLVLLGFNVALILAFLFGFIGTSVLVSLLNIQGLIIAFVPLFIIFIFSACSAVIWFRFGVILGGIFKKRKVINSSIVVLISVLPLLVFLVLLSGILGLVGGLDNEILAITFLGVLLMSILSAVFELLIITFGAITTIK